jgi:hypothetical protein
MSISQHLLLAQQSPCPGHAFFNFRHESYAPRLLCARLIGSHTRISHIPCSHFVIPSFNSSSPIASSPQLNFLRLSPRAGNRCRCNRDAMSLPASGDLSRNRASSASASQLIPRHVRDLSFFSNDSGTTGSNASFRSFLGSFRAMPSELSTTAPGASSPLSQRDPARTFFHSSYRGSPGRTNHHPSV